MDSCLIPHCGRMNVGVAHSEVNPNTRVMNSRGIWLAYIILVGLLHVVLLSIPFFSIPVVWTLTNVIHNLVSTKPHPCTQPRSIPKQNKVTNCLGMYVFLLGSWRYSCPKDYFPALTLSLSLLPGDVYLPTHSERDAL